ncbi:hypothetical protein KCP69_13835 [Salmonella enterica subsp. enterica]|nr:hypothetical protein KCP69_13835 [Salmonella enterica subsp. enterica]
MFQQILQISRYLHQPASPSYRAIVGSIQSGSARHHYRNITAFTGTPDLRDDTVMLLYILCLVVTVNSPDANESVPGHPGTGDNPCGLVINTGCDGLLSLKYSAIWVFSNSSGFGGYR